MNPSGVPAAPVGQVPVDTIRRHEVDAMLANQREIVSAARELKLVLITIFRIMD
jgi:hypothetical protein